MTLAVKAANPNDPEDVAWYRTQLRSLQQAPNIRTPTETKSKKIEPQISADERG